MPEIGENLPESMREKISRELSRLDTNDPTIKTFIEHVNSEINRRIKKSTGSRMEMEYIFESRVLRIFCEDRALTPEECSEKY